MLTMQTGDIWQYRVLSLYTSRPANYRVEHWLILDMMPGDALSRQLNYSPNFYKPEDVVIYYLCLESGRQSYKVFTHREWATSKGNVDLTGNPYYKKVA